MNLKINFISSFDTTVTMQWEWATNFDSLQLLYDLLMSYVVSYRNKMFDKK